MNADSERLIPCQTSETSTPRAGAAVSARWRIVQRIPWFLVGALLLIAFFVFGRLLPQMRHTHVNCNELAAVAACKNFADTEDIYHRTDWDSDGVLEYSPVINISPPYPGDLTYVDSSFAAAEGDPDTATPKAGYVFKVLTAQGEHAPGGAFSYIEPGEDPESAAANSMTHGYALVACPAVYGETGRQTFVVAHYGVVYGKDLGPETHAIYRAMTEYDPDETWRVAE